MMQRRTLAVWASLIGGLSLFAGGAWFYQRQQAPAAAMPSATTDRLVRAHSPVIGPARAPVTIVEFFDPACEACRAFHPYVKEILAGFPREARLVIRYTPFHKEPSIEGVRILEAARAQGRLEPVMDALLEAQPTWAGHASPQVALAWEAARRAGLDMTQAQAFVASGAADRLLELDVADLKAVGVRATPTFFVNGRPLPSPDPRVLLQLVKEEAEIARQRR